MKHTLNTTKIFTVITLLFVLITVVGDTKFIREFLSFTYNLHLFALALLVLTLATIFLKRIQPKGSTPPCKTLIYILLWFVYIVVYKLLGPKSESYYWSYLIVCFLVFGCVYVLLRAKALQVQALYVPIVFLGVYESVVVLLQFTQLLPAHSKFFSTTGSGSNPNITAMVICLAVPACVEMIMRGGKRFRYLNAVFLVLMISGIVATQCRSALLALLCVAVFFLFDFFRQITCKTLRYTLLVAPILLLVVFMIYFQQKKDSGNGRLTIWKLSLELIAEKPFSGYGYGFFEKAYNVHQSEYFNTTLPGEEERMNASYTGMAYNEYLEQSVMGGLVGGALFLLVVLGWLWSGFRQRSRAWAPFAGVLCFGLMSLFNFTVAYPMLLLFFFFYGAIITQDAAFQDPSPVSMVDNTKNGYKKQGTAKPLESDPSKKTLAPLRLSLRSKPLILAASLAGVVFVMLSLEKYDAQRELTKAEHLLKNGRIIQAAALLKSIEPHISTSEAFYTTKATCCIMNKDYKGARLALLAALQYTSNPGLMQQLAMVSSKLGRFDEAARYLQVVCGMEPHLFLPRMYLLSLYEHTAQMEKASAQAKEIVAMKPKFDSKQVQRYKKRAAEVLLSHAKALVIGNSNSSNIRK